ncbi:ParB N-terminal domain-containing protein [Sediminibacterium sp.]|uniref:ParB N-terminal domain-containing protein n=1 Tax=Sediminibacterium sp. TaxID=1917865 RepID=UPI003F7093D3
MYFIDFSNDVVTSIGEVNIDALKCHEEVVEDRLNSFVNYLQTLEGDILISSIIVCSKSMMIIDGHHRYHALKQFGIKKIPVTFINYSSPSIKAYFDDRILKSDIINIVNQGKLLPPKSSKHVIWDNRKKKYMPILLLSSIWNFNLNEIT